MKDSRESLPRTQDGWAPCAPGTFHSLKNAPHTAGGLAGVKPYATGLCLGLMLAIAAVAISSRVPQTEPQQALTCAEVKPLLVAYAAQDLDNDVAAQVRAHLLICAKCQTQFDRLAGDSYRTLLRDAPPRPVIAMVR